MRVNDDKDMAPVDRSDEGEGRQQLLLRRARALYRADHRGTRELDFLLGRFAKASLNDMETLELSHFEQLLALPDPILAQALIDGSGSFSVEIEALLERISHFHNNKN